MARHEAPGSILDRIFESVSEDKLHTCSFWVSSGLVTASPSEYANFQYPSIAIEWHSS
jgi:hypothetical protein